MLKLTLLGLISIICCSALAEPEIKGTAAELTQFLRGVPKTTLLTGEAEVRVPAHRAVISLKIVTEQRAFQDAMRENAQIRARLMDHLKKQGIAAERIKAAKFSSTPLSGIFTEKTRSFRIENIIRVTVQDDKELQGAAAAVDTWPEVQFAGVEFEYADKEALKEKALNNACDNVNQRKQVYEGKFGVQLVPVSFSQGEVNSLNTAANAGGYTRKGYAISSGLPESSAGGSMNADSPVSEAVSSFGELIYTTRITVEYSVLPK